MAWNGDWSQNPKKGAAINPKKVEIFKLREVYWRNDGPYKGVGTTSIPPETWSLANPKEGARFGIIPEKGVSPH